MKGWGGGGGEVNAQWRIQDFLPVGKCCDAAPALKKSRGWEGAANSDPWIHYCFFQTNQANKNRSTDYVLLKSMNLYMND